MTSNISIVIVDDEQEVLDSLSSMLRQAARAAGRAVLVQSALTALDALVLCRRGRVDAVFIDYNLGGGLNGDEFLSHLNDHTGQTFIVMMSGRPEDELMPIVTKRHQSLGLRFRFLKKPISPLTLESCFLNLVDLIRTRLANTILVIAPKPLEWEAWRPRLQNVQHLNAGFLARGRIGDANVVVALTGKGQATTAAAIGPLLAAWQPRYVLLVGIAGGVAKARRGDVAVASFVYSLDFGKIEGGTFRLRPEPNWSPDKKLLDIATMLAEESDQSWKAWIRKARPKNRRPASTTAHVGYFGSSEKVIDDLSYPMIVEALKAAPEILGVEMEAIGANAAIREMHANGQLKNYSGVIMIRGISDEPTVSSKRAGLGRTEREKWTAYAADVAAAFAEAVIRAVYPARDETSVP